MGLADDARELLVRQERERIRLWRYRYDINEAVVDRAKAVARSYETPRTEAPVERAELAVNVDWLTRGLILMFPDEELELLAVADAPDQEGEPADVLVDVYPPLPCRRCGRVAPHGPAVGRDGVDLDHVLVAGVPAEGHLCLPAAST